MTPAVIVYAVISLMAIAPATAACGDAVVDAGEDCDDGSAENGGANSCCTATCTFSGETPDVIVGEVLGGLRWGASGGITAYSFATISCNQGSCWLKWIAATSEHPVIGQNLYRLKNGRFEQLGQSWLKHGFNALADADCFNDCVIPPTGSRLGVHCSDLYNSGTNGAQETLGPKNDVNPDMGVYPYPDSRIPVTGDVIYKRLQVHTADLEASTGLPGQALFFAEGQYVTRDDAAAQNHANSTSYRRANVGASPNFTLSFVSGSPTQRQQAAIRAWQDNDPAVAEVDVPADDGLFILAAKATSLGGGNYHYEYAVQNLTNNRGARSFAVPIPPGAVITSPGFHDVDYHSSVPAELYDGTDWTASIGANSITWTTLPHATNPMANALRWGTLYNFRFNANVPPAAGTVTIGMFKPGSPTTATATIVTPNTCMGAPNGTACNDGDVCTGSDVCSGGVCGGTVLAPPDEVDNGVEVSESGGVATISWNLASGATGSSVLRGNVSALPVGPGDGDEICIPVSGAATSTIDSDVPAAGQGFWYLVRGTSACGTGTYGSAMIDGSPFTRSSTTCP